MLLSTLLLPVMLPELLPWPGTNLHPYSADAASCSVPKMSGQLPPDQLPSPVVSGMQQPLLGRNTQPILQCSHPAQGRPPKYFPLQIHITAPQPHQEDLAVKTPSLKVFLSDVPTKTNMEEASLEAWLPLSGTSTANSNSLNRLGKSAL